MDASQHSTPLLVGNHIDTQATHPSRSSRIPRKPVPGARAQRIQDGPEDNDEDEYFLHGANDTATTHGRPTSTMYPSQPRTAGQQPQEHFQRKPVGVMTGRLLHIMLVCAFLVLPLCGITIALLIEVYRNLLPPSNIADSRPCSGLLVDYGASQLTSLSTWISTVATLLAPAFMALLSYPIARSMTHGSQATRSIDSLPSPYQTSLLIELLEGNLVSLFGSLGYMISQKRARLSRLLPISFTSLFCAVLLGVLMQLADFWLHRATHSVIYKVSQPVPAAQYGRQLSQYCQNYYATDAGAHYSCLEVVDPDPAATNPPCSVVCGNVDFYPFEFPSGYILANSLPTNNSLAVIDVAAGAGIGKSGTVVAIMPSGVDANTTWTATTIGVSTHCEFILDRCVVGYSGSNIYYTCGHQVPPTGYNSSGPIAFSNQDSASSSSSFLLDTLRTGPSDKPGPGEFSNPWMFGLGMGIDAYVRGYDSPGQLVTSDDNVFALLQCNTTTHDVEYSVGSENRNASLSTSSDSVTIQQIKPSSENVHKTVQGHIFFAQQNTQVYLQKAMLGAMFSSNTDDEVLRKFEQEYGKVALSFAAPSFEGGPTISRDHVEQRIVSCVQRAPLWSLVGLVCVFIVLAIVLATVAMVLSMGNNVRSAQSQLSVAGLAAAAFEAKRLQYQHGTVKRMEDLFEELNSKEHQKDLEREVKRKRDAKRVGFRMNEVKHWEYHVAPGGTSPPHPNGAWQQP